MWRSLKDNNLKLLKYWLLAYLSNINDLYLAYKEPNAMVREPIEHLKVCDIPKVSNWTYKTNVNIQFLNLNL